MKYERLFSPITINGMELKNRIVMPAMHHLYTEHGRCTQRFAEYYYRRAEGGAGLILVGSCRFDDYGARENSMSLRDDSFIDGWKVFTDGMHARDSKVGVQLYHAGRYVPSQSVPNGKPALAPSAVFCSFTRETPPEMTREQMQEVIQNWADAAVRAQKAGFDIVELIGSVGYLICQFLSPVTNKRTDEYGGSWENRCRFPLEVIRAVRAAVGPDYPLAMRISGSDFIPGSNTNVEAAAFAALAEAAGIDLLNVTVGWHESKVPMITGDVPSAGLTYLGKAIKEAVSTPVAIGARVNDPYVAEEVLALERGDLVTIGRGLIADPDFPNKAKNNLSAEIRPCMGCNQGCLAKAFFDKPVECLVNGLCGREYEISTAPATNSRRILVVGGGPAGCEFAIRAAQRGHQMTLWEAGNALGGQLNLAAKVPSQGDFARLIAYYGTMLKSLGVNVQFDTTATADNIIAGKFDEVILALGGAPNITELPVQAGSVPVFTGTQVMNGEVMPGRNVVVIGGSFVGCSITRTLARRSSLSPEQLFHLSVNQAEATDRISQLLNTSDRTVTLVERDAKIGYGYEPGTAWPLLSDLERLQVKKYPNTKVTEINASGVTAEQADKDGNMQVIQIPCDTVIIASGVHPEDSMAAVLKQNGIAVRSIGNAHQLGKAIDAIREAASLGCEI